MAPWVAALGALASLGLGAVGALLWVISDHPWEGPVVWTIIASYGVHRGDLLAIVPLVASVALAAWCWRRRA